MTDILDRLEQYGITCIGNQGLIPVYGGTKSELQAFLASEKRELEEKLALIVDACEQYERGYILWPAVLDAISATSKSVEAFLNGVRAEGGIKALEYAANEFDGNKNIPSAYSIRLRRMAQELRGKTHPPKR